MSIIRTERPAPDQRFAAQHTLRFPHLAPPSPPGAAAPHRGLRRSVVGLDIDPGCVVAVETARSGAIKRAAFAELDAGVMSAGELSDVDALARALSRFFVDNQLSNRVRISLPDQRQDTAVHMLDAARRAGLRVVGSESAAVALVRALHQAADVGTTAYLNLGPMTNLAVASEAELRFSHTLSTGADSIARDLSVAHQLTQGHSRAWLRHVALAQPTQQVSGDPELIGSSRRVLVAGVSRIAADVRTSLDLSLAHVGGVRAERVVITGIMSSIDGLADVLAHELGLAVEVRAVPDGQPGVSGGIDSARLSVAAGLTGTKMAHGSVSVSQIPASPALALAA